MRIRVGLIAIASVAIGAMLGPLSSVVSVSQVGASTVKSCGTVTVSGYTASFSGTSVSCPLVKKWEQRLVKASLAHTTSRAAIKGPSGWSCIGSKTKTEALTEVTGNCAKGLGIGANSPYFNWSGSNEH
jgi:hypothetical protein